MLNEIFGRHNISMTAILNSEIEIIFTLSKGYEDQKRCQGIIKLQDYVCVLHKTIGS